LRQRRKQISIDFFGGFAVEKIPLSQKACANGVRAVGRKNLN
jgi:hypothetical protein